MLHPSLTVHQAEGIIKVYRQQYSIHDVELTVLFDGAATVFRQLKEADKIIIVLSNKGIYYFRRYKQHKMSKIERVIAYYDKADEEYVSEYLVDIDIDTIRGLWDAYEYDDQYQQMYPIEDKQKAVIEQLLGEPLELDKYDYFLESHTI